ncbi:MAG: non-canonical purine NTP pyrophosphatase [Bdellovibrionales bacterium]|nr:non-canonical purine NTP pyrophosphatase [Bdellovibrionales bacterium]
MILWIATNNKGKAEEFKLLLKEYHLYFLKDLSLSNSKMLTPWLKTSLISDKLKSSTFYQKPFSMPEEIGSSFKENARIKAQALKKFKPKEWVIGEDSGLEVPALGNAPGIYSARYAGPKATDKDNLYLLLKNMDSLFDKDRYACFVSHIIALSPEGKEYSCEGKVEGSIAREPIGTAGFGYDPVFIPKGETRRFSQLGMKYKNRSSHRFHAVQKIKAVIKYINRI